MADEHDAAPIIDLNAFASLPEDLCKEVAALIADIAETKSMSAGDVIFEQGEAGTDSGCIITEGTLRISKTSGTEIRCDAPVLIGEMEQFNPVHQRTATVIAATDLQLLCFSWHDFQNALHERLEKEDSAAVEKALADYAWKHFLG